MDTADTEPHGNRSSPPSTTIVAPRSLILLLAASVAVALLPSSMVNIILPMIAADVEASLPDAAWVVSGNLLALAVGVALGGPAADVFGVRRAYFTGLAAFAIGTALCMVAPSLLVLVAGRALQGVGEGVLPAVASMSVTRLLPPGQRGPALGLVFAGAGIGAASGPIVGGVVAQVVGWRGPFLGILLLCAPLLVVGLRVLPELRTPGRRYFDLLGGVLLAAAIGLGLFAVTSAAAGASTSLVIFYLGTAALAGLLLLWRVRSAPEPLFRPRMFGNAGFTGAAAIGFCAQLVNVTCVVLVPLLLVRVGGLPIGLVAIVLLPGPFTAAVVSPLAGRLSDRYGPTPVTVSGLVVMSVAALWLSVTAAGDAPVLLAIGVFLLGTGFGLINVPLTDIVARVVDVRELGSAMGLFQACYFIGGAVGPALASVLLDWREVHLGPPVNPLHVGSAVPGYSDVFLFTAIVILLAAAVTNTLPRFPRNLADTGG